MNRFRNTSVTVLSTMLVFIIGSLLIGKFYRHTYNWDSDVQSYISNYKCDFILLDSYKDEATNRLIYKYQTDDDFQIVFEVQCFWGNTNTPFGFQIPIKKTKFIDDFAEKICAYVSESRGTYDIANKSVEEISDYVLETVRYSKQLLYKYGIENKVPYTHFIFVDRNKTYKFCYGTDNEFLLLTNLIELLYE